MNSPRAPTAKKGVFMSIEHFSNQALKESGMPEAGAADMGKISTPSQNSYKEIQAQNQAIEQFLAYADEYYASVERVINEGVVESVYRYLDHFLLFLTAAAQNLISRTKLHCITPEALVHQPKLDAVLWAWEARNTIAHRYAKVAEQKERLLEVNGVILELNGMDLALSPTLQLCEVSKVLNKDKQAIVVHVPSGTALNTLKTALEFWKFVCKQAGKPNFQPPKERQYATLWADYESNPIYLPLDGPDNI